MRERQGGFQVGNKSQARSVATMIPTPVPLPPSPLTHMLPTLVLLYVFININYYNYYYDKNDSRYHHEVDYI